jgi:hypothetical protein
MKSLTVRLPDGVVREIERESQVRRVSKSDIVRERITSVPPRTSAADGNMRGLIGDILHDAWKAKTPVQPPRFSSPHKQRLAETIRGKKLHRR